MQLFSPAFFMMISPLKEDSLGAAPQIKMA